jgi:hypothetical protein
MGAAGARVKINDGHSRHMVCAGFPQSGDLRRGYLAFDNRKRSALDIDASDS